MGIPRWEGESQANVERRTLLLNLHRMTKLRSINNIGAGDRHAVDRVGVGIGLQMADFF